MAAPADHASPPANRKRRVVLLVGGPLTAAALALTACGGSSEPGYCADRGDLEQSVKDLGNVQVAQSGGVEKLKTQLQTIESNARTLVSSAKSDFPSETDAIDTSVTTLKTSVEQLPASPSGSQLAAVGVSGKGVVTSVQAFLKASDSKCS